MAIVIATAGAARAQTGPAAPKTDSTTVTGVIVQGRMGDFAGLVGNTMVLREGNREAKVQLHADGSYKTYLNGELMTKGTWQEDEGQLRYAQTYPTAP
jgi:hypothetical protein